MTAPRKWILIIAVAVINGSLEMTSPLEERERERERKGVDCVFFTYRKCLSSNLFRILIQS